MIAEINDLLDSTTQEERDVSGRTRGMQNDAFKSEREMEQALVISGIADADEDTEIGQASAR